MKRRILVFGSAFALYAVLLSVTWIVCTKSAREKTEAQLDFAVRDLHNTIAGAIDTMLGHVARTAVRHIGTAHEMSIESMAAGAKELDIDEVNTVSREGVIIASNDPRCMGVVMAGDPVMNDFMKLTNGVTATVSQPFRPHARNPEIRAKYLAAAFPGGDGFVQVGLAETTLKKMLPSILSCIFDEWLLGKTGFFLCADKATGALVSNPSRHRNKANTLAEAGYDAAKAGQHEVVADGRATGKTFEQTLFGEKCFCRAFLFGGHRFVAALTNHEFYDTRTILVSVFAVLLFAVLAVFSLFLDHIFRYSDRMRDFYAKEEALRAKDMEIAAQIQSSALPTALPKSASFSLDAAMQTAREVGGDFYDYFMLDATHVAFLVADVSGKGITAALYMMTSKTLIKDSLLLLHDPAAALDKVNAELCANNTANMFLTAWVGVLDLETGVVAFASAGHNPPIKIFGSRQADMAFVRNRPDPVLAFMDGATYTTHHLRLTPGDALFLYTDGVTEAMDSKGLLFGESRMEDALRVVQEPTPHALCTVVRSVVSAFAEGLPQADDITVLAIRYLEPPKRFARSFPPVQAGIADASNYLDEVIGSSSDFAPRLEPIAPVLHVILDEICSNIVRHSNASAFELDIEITDDPGGVKISFTDDGAAYDPLTHIDPDTTAPASERPIGGLGIMMVKKMSDSISYSRTLNRNILTVGKLFPPQEARS